MIKSPRLAPVVTGLMIWTLVFSQLALAARRADQSIESQKADSSDKSKAGVKKSKKRRKKKKTASVNSIFVPPIFTSTASVPAPVTQSQSTVPVPVAQPRTTTRATRTPTIHASPIAIRQLAPLSFSGNSSSPIEIGSENPDPEPIPAVPYSSDISVPILAGNVTSVSVTINNLIHNSPDDLDMLLVSPDNRTFHFWSDVGGSVSTNEGITVTVADTGNLVLPDDGPLVSGETYRPFNNDTAGDEFPVPAPGPPYAEPLLAGAATFASVFGGMSGTSAGGDWQLFVTDDRNGEGGSIAGGWSLNITTEVPATTAGQLIISEFRTNGPLGSTDEFIELYNTSAGSVQLFDPVYPTNHWKLAKAVEKEDFEEAVVKVKELIYAGECYQVVLSQRFSKETSANAISIYRAVRSINPSPYMFLLQLEERFVVGASPEMLVRCVGDEMEYRPIAGTRPRGKTPVSDQHLAQEMKTDVKEVAEHLMLVDLGRNDLGRVAEFGSVKVEELMSVEKYSHVQHLVSRISGKLKTNLDRFDALSACFPALYRCSPRRELPK